MKYREICPSCGYVSEIKEDNNLYVLQERICLCSSCGKAALASSIVNADMIMDPKKIQFEQPNSHYSNFRAIKNRESTYLLKNHIQVYSFLNYFNFDDFIIGIEKCFDDFRGANIFCIPVHQILISLNRIFPLDTLITNLRKTSFNCTSTVSCIKAGMAYYESDDPLGLFIDFQYIAENSVYYMIVLSTMIKEGIIDCKLTRAEIGLAYICNDMLAKIIRYENSNTRSIIIDKIKYIYNIANGKSSLSNSDDVLI